MKKIISSGFVYIWFDKKRKMYYVGCHWGTEYDGYICSSNTMRHAYRQRPEDFKRRIIARDLTSKADLLKEEGRWLRMIKDEELTIRYYNKLNYEFSSLAGMHTGYKHSEESRRKMSEAAKNRSPISEETRRKLSILGTGRKHSPESRQKMSEARRNPSEETRRKISLAHIGLKYTEESRRKMSEAAKNRSPISEETRRKRSESLRRYYANKHQEIDLLI